MSALNFSDGIFLVDFEFHPARGREGNPPVPVCMVVREWPSGRTRRYWQADLQQMATPPFPTGDRALCVAYYASAEMDCFQVLGWAPPVNVLDLFTEFRCLTNGLRLAHGSGLLGALMHYGLPGIGGEQKDAMRDLILTGGPWSPAEELAILDYCETDVVALADLLTAMQDQIDWPRALLRGRYMQAVSRIQMNGVPLDIDALAKLRANWLAIQDQLIADIDSDYGVYEGRTFKASRWEEYLVANDIPWPRLESGRLDMCDATFREMARTYVEVAPIRELRSALSEMRLANLHVGDDGRNRCLLSPFRARTGRNQPSNSKFIFGPSVWLRGLIRPKPGWGLAYVDWSQQEFGIAAALSGDPAMMEAYRSGDPYLAFANQAGAVPKTLPRRRMKPSGSSSRRACWRCSTVWVRPAWRRASTSRWRAPANSLNFIDAPTASSGNGRTVRWMRRCSVVDCGPGSVGRFIPATNSMTAACATSRCRPMGPRCCASPASC